MAAKKKAAQGKGKAKGRLSQKQLRSAVGGAGPLFNEKAGRFAADEKQVPMASEKDGLLMMEEKGRLLRREKGR